MRITLVTSPFFDHASYYSEATPAAQAYLPLGLLALAAQVRQSGAQVKIADLNDAYNRGVWREPDSLYRDAAEYLESFRPDILGFLTAYDSYHHIVNIAREFKNRNPGTPIVLGGYQASVVAEETIQHFPFIEAVVRGEGERSFSDLVKCYDSDIALAGVAGITYREKGKPVRNPDPPLIPDLDCLPFPAYDLYPVDAKKFVYLEVGRGCPFQCTYCSTAPFWKRRSRYKSPARVIKEMTILRDEYSVSQFHFVHDLLTVDKDWVRRFCADMKENGLKVQWTCSASLNTINEELIEYMADAGCTGIYFGVESGSEDIRKTIKKEFDSLYAERILRKALASGIAAITGFIAGFPFDTRETFRATLNTFFRYKELGVPLAHLFVAIPEKGSPLYQEYSQDLVFTRHFLDFPTSSALAETNFAAIARHPNVFCGFYRYKNPCFAEDFFLGSDEFSPLVNTVSVPVMIAADEIRDPVRFYSDWCAYISEHNRHRGRREQERFYGTIPDMLDFIRRLQAVGRIDVEYLYDILHYEATKNDFRRNSTAIEHSLKELNGSDAVEVTADADLMAECWPVQNPYNSIQQFEWDIQTLYSQPSEGRTKPERRTTFILFYVSLRQQATIADFLKDVMIDVATVRIDPITKVVLEMSDGRSSLRDILSAFVRFAERELALSTAEAEGMVMERVAGLQRLGALKLVRDRSAAAGGS